MALNYTADANQETSLRLARAAETLSPPADTSIRTFTLPARFGVGDELWAAFEADLANPAPDLPACGQGACTQVLCGGGGTTPATGATAGTPGTWTGGYAPSSVQDLQNGDPTVVANPTTPWTTGQRVQTGTPGAAGEAYWNGTAWVAGRSTTSPAVQPQISALTPNTATVGAGATTITVTGTDFVAPMTVNFYAPGDSPVNATATVVSPTQATASAPAGAFDTAGSIDVDVTTPGGVSNVLSITVA